MALSGSGKFNLNRFCPGCECDTTQIQAKFLSIYCSEECYDKKLESYTPKLTAHDRLKARRERKAAQNG